MKFFPSERDVQRAEARMGRRVFAAMAIVTVFFLAVIAVHYLLGWW